MSSSRKILPVVQLAPRAYKLGIPGGGNPEDEADPEVRLRRLAEQHRTELAALHAQLATEKEAAFAAGREEGLRQARQEAAQHLLAEQNRWAGLMQQLAAARHRAFAVSEKQLVELVLLAVEKIISGRPERREMITETLQEAFALLSTRDKLTIVCAPAEASVIRKLLDTHRSDFEDITTFSVREDPAIQPGGCLVETEWGTIDARVEKRLAVLKNAWGEAAHQATAETTDESA